MSSLIKDPKLISTMQELGQSLKSPSGLVKLSREPLKITVEASLNAEMDDHIGYAKHSLDGYNSLLPVTRMPSTSSWVFRPSLGETLTCSVRLNLMRQPQKSTLRRLPHDITP